MSTLAVTTFDKATIAGLTDDSISRLERDELVAAIRAAGLPFLEVGGVSRLEYLDRPTLERLLHLARRSCRHQGHRRGAVA